MSTFISASLLIRLLAAALCLGYLLSLRKARDLSATTWEELVLRLQPVRGQEIKTVAHTLSLDEGQSASEMFGRLYGEIGGSEGIRRMRRNAEVLIMLAAYTEVWSPGISASTVQKMRADGLRLKQAAWSMTVASFCARPNRIMVHLVRDLSRSYDGMVDKLLALYVTVHISRHPSLYAACGMQ